MAEEGKPVYAPADGFVSRIKIQAGGYGKALYLTHHNGYTTVYGHLSTFSDSLNRYIKSEQYRKESFEIELTPDSNLFRVKKGDMLTTSATFGYAIKATNPTLGSIVGKALEDKDYGEAGVIQIAVGRA